MKAENVVEEEAGGGGGISFIAGRDEVRLFAEAVYYDHDCGVATGSAGEVGEEIHTDGLPIVDRSVEGLE